MFSYYSNIYKAGSSELRRNRANRALRNMRQPQFTPTPQMTSMYERTLRDMYTPQGLTQQELGAAGQDIARGATTAFRLGTAAGGGNAAQALNAAVGAGMFGARSNLARMNAQRSLSNRQMAMGQNAGVIGQMQNLSNQNVQLDLERLRNLGLASQQARIERDQAFADYAKSVDEGVGGLLSMATGGMLDKPKTTDASAGESSITSIPTVDSDSLYTPTNLSFNMYNRSPRGGFNTFTLPK